MLQADNNPQNHPKPCLMDMQVDSLSTDHSLDEAIGILNGWKKKYGKQFKNLRVVLAERGERYDGYEAVLVLYGRRLETKEEVKRRLRHWATRFLSDQLTHVRMNAAYKWHLKKDLEMAKKIVSEQQLQRHEKDIQDAVEYSKTGKPNGS